MDKKLIVAVDVSNNTLSVAAAYRYPDNRIDIVDYRRQPIDIDTSNGIIHNPNNILSQLNDCMQDIEHHLKRTKKELELMEDLIRDVVIKRNFLCYV